MPTKAARRSNCACRRCSGSTVTPPSARPTAPLLLADLARRAPIQTTADLPAFWRGSWRDVVKDMKGRYPRHRWPDQPWAEDPSLKTRNAFEASRKS
jgi:ATP-dependent helicase HrpB